MHFDDRLATVLHHRAAGERAARVQFRQLVDLLGEPASGADPGLARAAFRRLDALSLMIPLPQRERIAAECSTRIRNPRLLAWFAGTEPKLALAALSRAQLSEAQWTALVPELPVRARGLLRHRRNLPSGVLALLDRLGVHDRILPEPQVPLASEEAANPPASHAQHGPVLDLGTSPEEVYVLDPSAVFEGTAVPAAVDEAADTSNLGALVRRIEAFQRAREKRADSAGTTDAPRLPLGGESPEEAVRAPMGAFQFTTDDTGRIDWADPDAASLVVGTLLSAPDTDGTPGGFSRAFALHRPVVRVPVELVGAEQVAGTWVADATPRFAPRSGTFLGYVGRLRRASPAPADSRALRAADRIRQLLHELRTPVTAIQGFAEVIQQQTVGPVPHEYRALAAGIAGDAARMLAGFDELERLARLEAGLQEMPEGTADFLALSRRQVAQLQTVLSPRVARLEARWHVDEAKVALAPESAELLAWRFLGTLAAATAAGERVALELAADSTTLVFTAMLPAALAQAVDVFAGDISSATGPFGTGLFGTGFALRLARAEARSVGGDLIRAGRGTMVLTLPLAKGHAVPTDIPHPAAERVVL